MRLSVGGRRRRVPLLRPELPPLEEIGSYYKRSVDAGFYANGGPCYTELAERLAARLGRDVSCVPTSSGTAALIVGLLALVPSSRRTSDEVLVPAFTFTASASAIVASGFVPSFIDVDPDSWQMCPDSLAAALKLRGPRVAAVLGCSTFGSAQPGGIRESWRAQCERFGVPLMVDSAAGFGSYSDEGVPLGSSGDVEAFSFHATKPFGIGEGGMLTTADPGLAERVRRIANFGIDKPRKGMSTERGVNAKISELACATALAALDRFDDVLRQRRASAARLKAALETLPVEFQAGSEGAVTQLMRVMMPSHAARELAVEYGVARGVEMRTYHDPPLHLHPAFRDYPRRALPVTQWLAARALSLPMANDLTDDDIAAITSCVGDATARGVNVDVANQPPGA